MKNIYAGLLGLTLTSAVALTANATDLYRGGLKDGPAPVYTAVQTWTGFYAGVNGGYGWTTSDYYDSSPSGGFGGGQIGYNWQGALGLASPWVLGIEADLQGSGISDSYYDGLEVGLNYFGTVRGRVGYAIDRTLLYVTGGYAYGEVEIKDGPWSASETQSGYVIGGGLEYKLNPAWSLKGEYQFISLDAKDTVWSLQDNSDRSELHTLRVGLNYHVGQTFAPLN